jgi:5-(carboxyamino)imidazole ribonucleotide synthase
MAKKICIGILGGGQLARMSTQAAVRLGFEVAILEKETHSPAGQLTCNEFIGWVNDDKVLRKFASQCDVITLENEFVDHQRLEFLEKLGKKVLPSSTTIALIQDKLLQKETLAQNDIPVPRFVAVEEGYSFKEIASIVGKPFVLKSRKMGYDGYGNALVRNDKEYSDGIKKLAGRHSYLMAESFIDFKMELAIMVARTKREIKVYPVVQTIQKNHICHTVIAPAQISNIMKKNAVEIGVESVKAIKGFGIFGIEMFLASDGSIIVNEMAPRPHNSGHYTIEACVTSQFENHIRAVLDLPLGETEMVQKSAVMINLLGKPRPQNHREFYLKALENPSIHIHVYGKSNSRVGRKMGHLTLIGNDAKQVLRQAIALEKKIRL